MLPSQTKKMNIIDNNNKVIKIAIQIHFLCVVVSSTILKEGGGKAMCPILRLRKHYNVIVRELN